MSLSCEAVSCVCIAEGWIDNDLANSFILVLTGLGLLGFLHQVYLWRETRIAESANEDFVKKRQENEVSFFLFFYTVAYLSGVSACSNLVVSEATAEKVVGGVLLPFYVFVPLWRLRSGASSVKAAFKRQLAVLGSRRGRHRHLGEADYVCYVFRSCAN
ncbi:hypothetical protein TrLO_g5495 [Triparma laevis f. longispina]|uniref:Uncharacterized protein n=1 Tax=Triparma laevis f. longispina TaxID=1714387 RepID=A0A9W7FG33_9STRA|nr:hypothetical protein TrLO_g5495 [Triparma laevis f. longispina]